MSFTSQVMQKNICHAISSSAGYALSVHDPSDLELN